MKTTKQQPALALPTTNALEDLKARRAALRTEVQNAPDWKQAEGSEWHTARVNEIHALTRRIQAMEDEEIMADPAGTVQADPEGYTVTLRLGRGQFEMAQEMATYDSHADVAALLLYEVEAALVSYAEGVCHLREEATRAAWKAGRRRGRDENVLVTVTQDEHCSELARYSIAHNEHAPCDHLGDLVNAAVAFFTDDTEMGVATADFVKQARARRLAACRKKAA